MLSTTPDHILVHIFQKMDPRSMTRSLRCSYRALALSPRIRMIAGFSMEVKAGRDSSRIIVYQKEPLRILYDQEIQRNQLIRTMKRFEPFMFSKITLTGTAAVMREIFENVSIICEALWMTEHCRGALNLIEVMKPTTAYLKPSGRKAHRIYAKMTNLPRTFRLLGLKMRKPESLSAALDALPSKISIDVYMGHRRFDDQAAILDTIVNAIRNAQTTGKYRTLMVTVRTDVLNADLINLLKTSVQRVPNTFFLEDTILGYQYQFAVVAKSAIRREPVLLKGYIHEQDVKLWCISVSTIYTFTECINSLATFFKIPENHIAFNDLRNNEASIFP